ncbi:hypothetical protein ADK52_33570 [Streptomyces sp. WM6372]|nr:hypothetical protein ADK52_33570 [Streptomyces sp. WM6372]
MTREDGVRRARPGGSPANVALGLARLGHPVRLATRIGRDGPGRELHAHLRGSGVVLTPGSFTEGATSTATARLDAAGSAHYTFDITWDPPLAALTAPASGPAPAHLHTGSVATALAPGADRVFAAVEAARPGATVSYDPNIRPALLTGADRERPRAERFVALSDVVKASEEDLGRLYPGRTSDEAARHWADGSGPALVVVTSGGAGARVFWPGGQCRVPATAVKVADTVGAGDAFMAGLISGLLHAGLLACADLAGAADAARARTALREATARTDLDGRVASALVLASRAAALTCTREGADPPTRTELARWAAGGPGG